jgi:hypothetical protein
VHTPYLKQCLPIVTLSIGLILALPAQATLYDRSGGLIYDGVLNISWLQNANLAATNTFGVSGITSDGRMNWGTATKWIDAMNGTNYLGYHDWRLPTLTPVNGVSFNINFRTDGSSDAGFNISAPSSAYPGSTASEMAYMYSQNLGNPGPSFDPNLGDWSCGFSGPCFLYSGPFSNIKTDNHYWTDRVSDFDTSQAWVFGMSTSIQGTGYMATNYMYAWAVRPGDVAAVPEPETYSMLLAGLGMMGWAVRRKSCVSY